MICSKISARSAQKTATSGSVKSVNDVAVVSQLHKTFSYNVRNVRNVFTRHVSETKSIDFIGSELSSIKY
jgi:hypothetical protein